jgi:hypothetical protein
MIVSILRMGRLRPLEDRMGSLSTGGGTSAVAASAHAGCERSRLTDPRRDYWCMRHQESASNVATGDLNPGRTLRYGAQSRSRK